MADMSKPILVHVALGEDVYLGTPEEVVDFMRRAEGAPQGDRAAYMAGIAARVASQFDGVTIDTDSCGEFLESLARAGFATVRAQAEPSEERVTRAEALGDGPIAFGADVDYRDLDLG